ncbi:unnamed protein product, partial [Rotaria sordida]
MIQLQRSSDDFEDQSLGFSYMTISTPGSTNDGTMAAIALRIVEGRLIDMTESQPIGGANDTCVE